MANDVNCKHYDSINGWCEKLSYFGYPKRIEYCSKSPCEYAEPIEQSMTDNDIIKMIEYCFDDDAPCEGCPLYDDRFCKTEILESALDLINRQKAEIERLYIANKINQKFTETWKDIAHRETGYVKIARAEAIKEFAERLRNKFFNYYDGLTEHTSKSNHNGDSLMFYEVADMITDCIESTEEEMTEGEDEKD